MGESEEELKSLLMKVKEESEKACLKLNILKTKINENGEITTDCGKFLKRWEYLNTFPASWEICMQVKKQQLELDMKQQTGSKLGREYVKAMYFHPAI